MKRKAVLGLMLFFLVFAVLACNRDRSTTAVRSQRSGTDRPRITVSVYDRGSCDPSEGTMTDNRWTRWVNENAPVEVVYIPVPRWESTRMWPTMFATGTAPDLVLEFDVNSRNMMFTQRLIQPIDGLLADSTNYRRLTEQFPSMLVLGRKTDGLVYDIVVVGYRWESRYLAYRADWLEQLGIAPPATDTELFAAMKAIADSGLGGPNTFGFNLGGPGQFIISTIYGLGTLGADWFNPWYLENDQIVMNWDKIAAYITFQKDLFDQGIIDRDFLTDTNGEKAYQDWLNGRLGFVSLNQSVDDPNAYSILLENNPGARIGFLPIPSTQFGHYGMGTSTGFGSVGVINRASRNADAVMAYIDFMLEDSTIRHFTLGPENEYFTQNSEGLWEEIDPGRTALELNYNIGYQMPISDVVNPYRFARAIATDELSQAVNTLRQHRRDTYRVDYPMQVDNVHNLPPLDDHLTITLMNASQICRDIIAQTIVGGSRRTVEAGIAELRSAWQNAGGNLIIQYFNEWYRNNTDNAITNKDIYAIPWEK